MKQTDAPTLARVAQAGKNSFGTVGTTQLQGLSLFGIPGVEYRPKEQDLVLLLPVEGAPVCIGALQPQENLPPGELRLSTPGGAMLHLKNNGDIVLNGVTLTKEGNWLPKP